MAKHNITEMEKRARNAIYALKFLQKKCKDCGHKSSRKGRCALCSGEMK